jgi:hypothetical protein
LTRKGAFGVGLFLSVQGFWRFLGTERRGLIRDFEISQMFWNKLQWRVMSGMEYSGAGRVPFSSGQGFARGVPFPVCDGLEVHAHFFHRLPNVPVLPVLAVFTYKM